MNYKFLLFSLIFIGIWVSLFYLLQMTLDNLILTIPLSIGLWIFSVLLIMFVFIDTEKDYT